MIKYKQHIIDSLGRVVFIVLFTLLISAFSDKSVQTDHNVINQELVADLSSNNADAVIINPIHAPSFQNNWVSVVDRMYISFINEDHQILADNKKTDQIIITLQKKQLLIKPNSISKFCYHLFLPETEDLPILS